MDVTIDEYLNAVEVVKKFHNQINKQIEKINKTPLSSFLIENPDLNKRLVNALITYASCSDNETYIEDVNKKEFLRIRDAGLKTWTIFDEIRRMYLYNKSLQTI